MPFSIREDDPGAPDVAALLDAHLAHSLRHAPRTSIHTLDGVALRAPQITFWTVRNGLSLVGCGALKELDPRHGEVKSMYMAPDYRGQGAAGLMLDHIVATARCRGYVRLSLETGSMAAYAPARALYRKVGFVACGPFAEYRDDLNSVFMTLALSAGPAT